MIESLMRRGSSFSARVRAVFSWFVRLSRCNLACQWCDTAYTWRFTGDNRPHRGAIAYDRALNQVSLDEANAAAQIASLGQPRLVVSGGEPLLQGPALARLLALLRYLGLRQVELLLHQRRRLLRELLQELADRLAPQLLAAHVPPP